MPNVSIRSVPIAIAGLEKVKSIAAVHVTSPPLSNRLRLTGLRQRDLQNRAMKSIANGHMSNAVPIAPFSASVCI